jgi:hypothetical protein
MKIILSLSLLFIASAAFAQSEDGEQMARSREESGGGAMPAASAGSEIKPISVVLPVVERRHLGKPEKISGKCAFKMLKQFGPHTFKVVVETDNAFQEKSISLPLSGRDYDADKKVWKIELQDEIAIEVHTDPYIQSIWEIDFRYVNDLPPDIVCQEASS